MLLVAALAAQLTAPLAVADDWEPLFNGEDLAGWTVHLGEVMPVMRRADPDPRDVFTVVEIDGEPAIRVSGEIWGPLISDREFEDFHLRLEFRWGDNISPPLDFRDTGVMYHSIGQPGAVGTDGALVTSSHAGYWMESVEYQVTEQGKFPNDWHSTQVGAAHSLSKDRVTLGNVEWGASRQLPVGEWNVIEIVCRGNNAVHFLNGEVVARVHGIQHLGVPLTRGRLQIQSESAEVFFRRIMIRPLKTGE